MAFSEDIRGWADCIIDSEVKNLVADAVLEIENTRDMYEDMNDRLKADCQRLREELDEARGEIR